MRDTLIAAGMNDAYRFYKDGKFNFDFGSFNYNERYVNISGTFIISGNEVTFEVNKTVELIGGEISFGDDESDYNSWTIANQKVIVSKLSKKATFTVNYELSDDKKILIIAGLPYYKISSDPNAERDMYRFPK